MTKPEDPTAAAGAPFERPVGRLPPGWRVADDVTIAHIRWATHVLGQIGGAVHCSERVSYVGALVDLRKALVRMGA